MTIAIDPSTTKYLIRAELSADGVVEKPDVVGAIFGQTEGLLGDELDLRDLQKSGRIGRIEVNVDSKKGKSTGEIILPSSLDKVETAILAAALESIDRVGPCKAEIKVLGVEDVRISKRKQVIDRAKQLLQALQASTSGASEDITDMVRDTIRTEEIVSFGAERLPAGPTVSKSDSILVVEGRNDVINLLKNGITNAIAVEGTSVPQTIINLTKEKTAIAFVDGDRGGELILKELLQTAEVDFIARAPRAREVEELSQKQIMKCLRNKIPAEQFTEMYSLEGGRQHQRETRDNVRGRGPRDARGGREPDDDDYVQSTASGQPVRPSDEDRPWEVAGAGAARPQQPQQQPREERRDDRRRDDRRDDRRGDRRDDRRGDRRDDRRGGDRRDERREPREERREPPAREAPREERIPSPEPEMEPVEMAPPRRAKGAREEKYVSLLEELGGKLQAILLDEAGERVGDVVAVRDLADTLKKDGDKVKAVVFDGVITQRLLDIAADKKIATLVGVKTGNITKKPSDVEVLTKADLA
ncbi:MAG TPA: DNA primase DnaG [Candidatus Thermoplasmatota archaeon]|nr:DNA primase DnaG [Candidatus Thermoplasmatota archaeon]